MLMDNGISKMNKSFVVITFFLLLMWTEAIWATVEEPPPDNSHPAWSPDGTKIAFVSDITEHKDNIWIINVDGTGLKRLTLDEVSEGCPAWSPDGEKIAFASSRSGNPDIWVINVDGTGLTQLTTWSGCNTNPAWSPDGTKIAYEAWTAIQVINEDGTGKRLLTTAAGHPTWSPDGNQIAFSSPTAVKEGNLWNTFLNISKINIDGTGLVRLTFGENHYRDPVWSPDGTKIIFTSVSFDREGENAVWSISPDGTELRKVFSDPDGFVGWNPAWSPDGEKIAISKWGKGEDEAAHIWIIDSTGENPQQLTFLNDFIYEVVPAVIDIDPDVLNLKSKGEWITSYIELPEGYDVYQIDLSTVMLNGAISAEGDPKYGFVIDPESRIGDYDNDEILDCMVKFKRSDVQEILEVGDEILITITGKVEVQPFKGTDTIRVIGDNKK